MGKLYKTILCAKASVADVDAAEVDLSELPAKTNASDNEYELDRDLMKIVSVLLSVGMNKNDDVFLAEEILPVRFTGAHKPVNVEHDRTKIVGHILKTYATTKEGAILSESELEAPPLSFDITNESVLYKYLLPEIAQDVLSEALSGELFVSVEAWFTDYDYLVGDKIIRRNDKSSSVLDDLLRANGGEGFYKGHVVGRILRNILIGGVGLTSKPANPESVIKSISNKRSFDVEYMDNEIISSIVGSISNETEIEMKSSDDVTEEIKKVVAFIRSEYEKKIEKLTASDEAREKLISELQDSLDVLAREKVELQGKVDKYTMKETTETRRKVLAELYKSESMIEKKLEHCSTMGDDEFENFISLIKEIHNDFVSDNKELPEGGEVEDAKEETKEEVKEEVKEEPVEVKPEEKETKVEKETEPEPAKEPEKETEPKTEKEPDPKLIKVQSPPQSELVPKPIMEIKVETDKEVPKLPSSKVGIPTETPSEAEPEVKTAEPKVIEKPEVIVTDQDKEPRLEKPKTEETPVPVKPTEKEEQEEVVEIDIDSVVPIDVDVIPETEDEDESIIDSFKKIVDKIKTGWQRPTI